MRRTFHPVGIVLKGSGFHKTDYGSRPKEPKEKASTDSATSSDSTKSQSKSETKKTETKKTSSSDD